MVRYLLDTDTFSLLLRGSVPLQHRLAAVDPSEVALTVITIEEQMSGRIAYIRKAKKKEDVLVGYEYLRLNAEAFKLLPTVGFGEGALIHFENLKAARLNFDANNDLRIAAIALDLGAAVITRNVRDFMRVPNLQIENWAEASP